MKNLCALSISVSVSVSLAGVCAAGPPGLSTSVAAFLDVNGDGVISESERQAYEESRASVRGQGNGAWDLNGDGAMDEGERQSAVENLKGRMDGKVASLFLDLAGEDELLTLGEFSALPRFANTPPNVAGNLFGRLDADQDGFVNLTEFFKGTGRGNPPVRGKAGVPSER